MKTLTKRVGNWSLEWSPDRPNTVYAVPEYTKTLTRSDNGILYNATALAVCWNQPEAIPQAVRNASRGFVLSCQATLAATS